MSETSDHPSLSVLRELSTLREMTDKELQTLSDKLFVQEEPRGTVLLELHADSDDTLYLLEGNCKLFAEDGAKRVIHHTDPSAQAPLARLRPSRYKVVAETEVRFLRMQNSLVCESAESFEQASSSLVLDSYEVQEDDDYGHMDAANRLTLQIYEDLNANRLLLPSLPHVAVRIGEAVNDEDSDAKKIAGLIETDPAIAAKIVKAANSARFGGAVQTATVTDAVTRLGMKNTQMLVITFALREMFRTDSRLLEKRMMQLWEHSRRIGALARVLGEKTGRFNPHESLLAGLVHDIGGLAVIAYAKDFPEVVENPAALESSINSLRSQLSSMILSKWMMPEALVNAAKEAENWYRDHTGEGDYADLVIVAQIHEGVAGDIDPAHIPALARLGLAPAEIDSGLELLHNAHQEVEAAKRLLSA